MLHLAPESFAPYSSARESAAPYAEALARLAGIRHALRLVDPFGGGPASDPGGDTEIGAAWAVASHSRKRCFDRRTEGSASAAAAGLEALLAERGENRMPNPAASEQLVEEIRISLEGVSRQMFGEQWRSATPAPLPFPIAL